MENSNNLGKRPRPWRRILLIGSLSLNLLIFGAVIGAAVKWRGGAPRSDNDAYCGSVGMTSIVRAMERSERAVIRDAFESGGYGRDFRRAAAQEDIEGLIAILNSDPLDLEGLESMLGAKIEQVANGLYLGNKIIVDQISSMPVSERRNLAERMAERDGHHMRKR